MQLVASGRSPSPPLRDTAALHSALQAAPATAGCSSMAEWYARQGYAAGQYKFFSCPRCGSLLLTALGATCLPASIHGTPTASLLPARAFVGVQPRAGHVPLQ